MCRLYLLLCLFYVVACQWEEPMLLQRGGYAYETGIYLAATGEIFAFYSKDQSICYKVIKEDKILTSTCLYQARVVNNLTVTGTNNGAEIFVAFAATRTASGKGCNNTTTVGCMDVYYIESKDLGNTWTNALAVTRRNYSDSVNRTTPKVLHISETGRTFIFYIIPGEDMNYIYDVDRPKTSSTFSLESKVYENRYGLFNLKAEYINVWDSITIYVGYECLFWFSIVYSSDNGVRWSKPTGLQYVSESLQYVMTKPESDDNLFVATMDIGLLKLYVIDDEGSIVSDSFYHIGEHLGYRPFVVAYPGDGLRYLIGVNLERKKQSTYVYNVGQKLLTDLGITGPVSYSDKAIVTKDNKFRIRVLHNITDDLYMSTLSFPID